MKICSELKKYDLSDFKGGWFIGDFEPSLLKSENLEVSVKHHPKGELWDTHFHKVATEYNYLISGSMKVNGIYISAGEIFVVPPYYVVAPEFLEDCQIVCVKVPGAKNDKYVCE